MSGFAASSADASERCLCQVDIETSRAVVEIAATRTRTHHAERRERAKQLEANLPGRAEHENLHDGWRASGSARNGGSFSRGTSARNGVC